jgi:hypothetical protein
MFKSILDSFKKFKCTEAYDIFIEGVKYLIFFSISLFTFLALGYILIAHLATSAILPLVLVGFLVSTLTMVQSFLGSCFYMRWSYQLWQKEKRNEQENYLKLNEFFSSYKDAMEKIKNTESCSSTEYKEKLISLHNRYSFNLDEYQPEPHHRSAKMFNDVKKKLEEDEVSILEIENRPQPSANQ